MEKYAWVAKLKPGKKEEYIYRHDHIWPEMKEVLKESMKMILNEDATDLLPNIDAPTLLIWGGLDRDTPIDQGRKMEKLIPNAGLVEYPYGSHFAYLENIQNVNVVLNEFLKDLK